MKSGVRANREKKKRSYVKIGLAAKAEEARQLSRGRPEWLERADKLEALRGEMAVAVWNMRERKDFWAVLDRVNLPVPQKKAAPKAKSSPGVSLRDELTTLKERAVQKLLGSVPASEEHMLWTERLRKLRSTPVHRARILAPLFKSDGVWDAIDKLPS